MVRPSLTVLTVTYGSRSETVSRTINSVLAYAESRIIVVSNGSSAATRDRLDEFTASYPDRIVRVDVEQNVGSAPAFAEGLRIAYTFGDPVLILDDDNPIDLPTMTSLIAIANKAEESALEPIALVVHRPVNLAQRSILSGARVGDVFRELSPGAFHGFNLFDRATARSQDLTLTDEQRDWTLGGRTFKTYRIPVAMWGGIFLTSEAVRLNAVPLEDLVLYGDDNDFSRRFRAAGGSIHLIDGLKIMDSEAWRPAAPTSWTWRSRFPSTFRTAPESTWRLQYLFRNQAYLSRVQASGSGVATAKLAVNAFVRMSAVIVLGILAGRPGLTWRLTTASIAGLRSKLGATYPLPQ